MRLVIAFWLCLILSSLSFAQTVPENYLYHKDTFVAVIKEHWSDVRYPDALAGQVEQETCIRLTHKRCWSRFASLETSREYGFGLGQITVTDRFNTFNEVKELSSALSDWKWEERFDARRQMIALVVMMKRNVRIFRSAINPYENISFALAAYNGGIGGIQADQRICRNTKGCDPNIWFGNVEHTSLKSKVKYQGYGKSFFEINREYPRNILEIRRFKYQESLKEQFCAN